MARVHGILLLIAVGLVAHSDGLLANYKLALQRMLRREAAGGPAELASSVIILKPFHLCSGTIVSRAWIMTVAHCVERTDPSFILLVAANDVEAVRQVSHYVIHDEYDAYRRHYDVALLRVSKPFEFSANVHAMALSTQPLAAGTVAQQVQFCVLEDGSDAALLSNRTVLACGECEQQYGAPLRPPVVCASSGSCASVAPAGPESHGLACYAEAGAPLLAAGRQVALLTWPGQWSDPPRSLHLYLDVAALHPWIQHVCAN